MPATQKLLEKILSEFAVALINMADQPGPHTDKRLKDTVKTLAAALAAAR